MNIMKWNYKKFLTAALTGALVIGLNACGGGGDGGGNTYQPGAPITITTANSPEVAATAAESDSVLSDVPLPLSLTENNSASSQTRLRLRDFVTRLIVNDVLNSGSNATTNTTSLLGSTPSLTAPCLNTGGSKTEPDSADLTGTYSFTNCDDGDGFILNGSFTISGNAVDNNPDFTVNFSITFNDLTATAAGNLLFKLNGTMGMNMTININTFANSGTFSISKLTVELPNDIVILSSFKETFAFDGGSLVTYGINYTVDSSSLGGSFKVETIQTFAQVFGQDYPYEGELIITGAATDVGFSKIKVTALDSSTVRVATDADGDGTYESEVDYPWADFFNLI